jgi:hypothetical protein
MDEAARGNGGGRRGSFRPGTDKVKREQDGGMVKVRGWMIDQGMIEKARMREVLGMRGMEREG